MALYSYNRIQKTLLKTEVDAWLTSLTSGSDKRIVSYTEAPAVDAEDNITIKVLIETIA